MKYPVQIDFQQNGLRDVMAVFDTIEKRITRLAQVGIKSVDTSVEHRVRAEARGADNVARIAEKAATQKQRIAEKEARETIRVMSKVDREVAQMKARAEREHERTEKSNTRTSQREAKQRVDAELKGMRDVQRSRERFGRAVGHSAVSMFGRVTSSVGSLANHALSVGGGFSLDGALTDRIRDKSQAVDISNSGYMPGKAGPNGMRRSTDDIMGMSKGIGAKYGFSNKETMDGLAEFVGKTGDLDTGMRSMEAMAQLTRATGANMKDVASAAGDVAMALDQQGIKTTPDMLAKSMMMIAGQGKEGAVEIKNMAVQAAALGAVVNSIDGDKAHNLGIAGAIAQQARAKGGAKSAAEAVNSVSRLRDDVVKHQDKFAALGIKTTSNGKVRDMQEIIQDTLMKTGGDVTKMNGLKVGVMGQRAIGGFASVFRDAGGGEKGLEAVKARFKELTDAEMDKKQLQESAAAKMQETEMKIAVIREKLSAIVGDKLLPAFEKLLPKIEQLIPKFEAFVTNLTKVIDYISENPFKTAIAGLGIIIAAAFAKEIAAAQIGALISKLLGGGVPGGPGAAGGGMSAGGLAGGVVVAGVASSLMATGDMVSNASASGNHAQDLMAMMQSGDPAMQAKAKAEIDAAKQADTIGARIKGFAASNIAMGTFNGGGGLLKSATGIDLAGTRDSAIANAQIVRAAEAMERLAKAADSAAGGVTSPGSPNRLGPMTPATQ